MERLITVATVIDDLGQTLRVPILGGDQDVFSRNEVLHWRVVDEVNW